MKNLLIILLILTFFGSVSAQDVLTTTSGKEIKGWIKEIGKTYVNYVPADSTSQSEISLQKSKLLSIHFSNGVNMVFDLDNSVPASSEPNLYKRGVQDASRFYSGYRAAGTGTLISGLCFPVFGLIPAVTCSSTVPSIANLGIRNDTLSRNRDYLAGYSEQARKVKSKKVWKNYSIGAGIGLGFRILFVLMTITVAKTGF